MQTDATETQLAAAIKGGSRDAFKEAYMSSFVSVKNYLRSFVNDEELVMDFAQDAFILLWKHRKRLNPEQGFKSYLFSTARNEAFTYFRRKKCFDKFQTGYEVPEDDYMRQHIEKDYWNMTTDYLNNLPETHKETFMLKRWNGLTNKEVAERMNVSEKTVEYRMTKVLKYLSDRIRRNI